MINDDEDNDGMYDGASDLKVFILYLKLLSQSFILFSKQYNIRLLKISTQIILFCLFLLMLYIPKGLDNIAI